MAKKPGWIRGHHAVVAASALFVQLTQEQQTEANCLYRSIYTGEGEYIKGISSSPG